MTQPHFAWFHTTSKDGWRLLNSLADIRAADVIFFEWGQMGVPNSTRSVILPAFDLQGLLPTVTQWTNTLTANPVMVFGSRNLFHPLIHHWGIQSGIRLSLPFHDILETCILPCSIPTIQDRMGVDQEFAQWLTGKRYPNPFEFLYPLLTHAT